MIKNKISIAIPVLNEGRNIGKCLSIIYNQNYNKKLIEVIIVDAGSTDRTMEIVKKFSKYGVKILDNSLKKDYDTGKMIALKKAAGEFFMYLDADMFLDSNNWIKKMIVPFSNKNISATFTKFVVKINDNALNRYLSYDSLQRDPLYKFLTPGIESVIVKKEDSFYLCKLRLNNPPPIGLCLYRTELLKRFFKGDRFQDLEVPLKLLIEGYGYFAYIPNTGVHHAHVNNIKHLIKKRMRNINIMNDNTRGYIPDYEKRLFKWVDFTKKSSILKIGLWVIYANLLIPLFISGIYKMLKYKDGCFMLEPVVGLAVTDSVLWSFIKNRQGLKIISGTKNK